MAKQTKITKALPDYIILSEYIRRKHALMLENDPFANPVDRSSIMRAVERGDIELYRQGTMVFIDWNKYKGFLFRQYGQMPVKKTS